MAGRLQNLLRRKNTSIRCEDLARKKWRRSENLALLKVIDLRDKGQAQYRVSHLCTNRTVDPLELIGPILHVQNETNVQILASERHQLLKVARLEPFLAHCGHIGRID